ncbi:MAG TPA: hypothetical protein VFZ15_04125 [Acidimicrobiia bacterium]|nr:hypothetical protein [Acidimicrobiia bacterium]
MTEHNDADVDRLADRVTDAMAGIFGEASPGSLFSTPTQVGEDLIITAVAWERAGGFGFGAGRGQGEAGDTGVGGGGGGGGASQGRPVAVIHVSSGGVDVRPVIDFTKIGITLLLGLIGVWRALRH